MIKMRDIASQPWCDLEGNGSRSTDIVGIAADKVPRKSSTAASNRVERAARAATAKPPCPFRCHIVEPASNFALQHKKRFDDTIARSGSAALLPGLRRRPSSEAVPAVAVLRSQRVASGHSASPVK